jgi:hypothetical protein
LLWAKYGYGVAFYGGAVIVFLSVLAVLKMKVPTRKAEPI